MWSGAGVFDAPAWAPRPGGSRGAESLGRWHPQHGEGIIVVYIPALCCSNISSHPLHAVILSVTPEFDLLHAHAHGVATVFLNTVPSFNHSRAAVHYGGGLAPFHAMLSLLPTCHLFMPVQDPQLNIGLLGPQLGDLSARVLHTRPVEASPHMDHTAPHEPHHHGAGSQATAAHPPWLHPTPAHAGLPLAATVSTVTHTSGNAAGTHKVQGGRGWGGRALSTST